MGQNQVLDARFFGDLSDHRRRHVQVPLNSCGTFWYGIVSNEQIGIRRQLPKSFTLTIRIPAEHDSLGARFNPPR
jgi:hypothetical protein